MSESTAPLRNESLRARVYGMLRARIHRGEIGPNEKLVDVEIGKALGASRMPVREALLQLMHEGYLVGTTRGFMLPQLTAADIADIFEVRRCLEPRAAAQAAHAIDAAGMQELRMALNDAERALDTGDGELLFQANARFRTSWFSAVRNERLAAAITRFADHVQVVRFGTLKHQPTHAVVVAGMRKLFRAFEERDAMAAYDHMTSFIQAAEDRFAALATAHDSTPAQNRSTASRGKIS